MFGPEDCQLFVGDLNENINEQILYSEFAPYGKILSLKIMRDLATKKSRGHGFINFANSRMAQIAKEKMNGATIMGSKIRVMNKGENLTMNKDCIVMISNIDPAMTHEEFESMCTKYGQVKNLKYTTDINDTFTNRAVVCFSSPEEAAACVNGLHSTKIKDKIVVASLNNKSSKILVVKGDIEKAKVDEIRKKLENFFKKYGVIISCNITQPSEKQRFVCFVEFEDKKSVDSSIAQGSDILNSIGIKNAQVESYQEQQAHHHSGQQAASRSNILMIKPLKSDVTKEKITTAFSKYDQLKSVEISKLESEHNKENWQQAKVTFDNTKSLRNFYHEYAKDSSLLSDLAPKGKELHFTFPYNLIEEAKRKFHNSKSNKYSKGGENDGRSDQNSRQRGGGNHQSASNYYVNPQNEQQMNIMMNQIMMMQQMNMMMRMNNPMAAMGIQLPPGAGVPTMSYGVPQMQPIQSPAVMNPAQKRQWILSQISPKVIHLLASQNKQAIASKVLESLTDVDLFSEQDQNRFLQDQTYLQSQVLEIVKILEETNN